MQHPIAPPFVDVQTEAWGGELRAALWDLFEELSPDEVREMVEELFGDIAAAHGWSQNCDGEWWRPASRLL